MSLCCKVLDLLTLGKHRRAADFVAQHLKAQEQALVDGNWERARYLTLMDDDAATLVNRDEKYMMRSEAKAEQQLNKGGSTGKEGKKGDYSGNWHQVNPYPITNPFADNQKGKNSSKGKPGGKGKGKWWKT